MENLILILWNSGSVDEARRVCRYLVQERLVACANIVPWVESIYMWNNQLETEQESTVLFKTRESNFDRVKEVIEKNSNYDVPEVLKVVVDSGNEAYFKWAMESSKALQET
tara:strand:- start:239 stop:571 length:333 start_codon:yes stop_codon:yes gene_type:complete